MWNIKCLCEECDSNIKRDRNKYNNRNQREIEKNRIEDGRNKKNTKRKKAPPKKIKVR